MFDLHTRFFPHKNPDKPQEGPRTRRKAQSMSDGPRLLLSGYFGFGNLGDEAIFEAMVTALRKACPEVRLSALTHDVTRAESFGVTSVPRKHFPSVLKALRSCDLLISGGGGLVQDSTGLGSVVYYLGMCRLARLLGVPTMFYSQGFGPVRSSVGKWMTRALANGISLITLRDQDSADEMKAMGVTRPPIRVTADPALLLEPPAPAEMAKVLAREELTTEVGRMESPNGRNFSVGPLVAVTVRPWPGLDVEALARNLEQFGESHKARYLVIPFHPDLDMAPSEELCRRLQGRARLVGANWSPAETAGLLRCCDMVVGMRLHSLILAAAANMPMIGLCYDPKVERFVRRAGAVPLRLEEVSSDKLVSALVTLMDGRKQARKMVSTRVQEMLAAARGTAAAAIALARREPIEAVLQKLEPEEEQ
jgi:polysaccharide pyruvyl transferase CsaB